MPSLDAHRLRADFPIFEQRFHGKPLAFLDSAASAQKPRAVLEAMTTFYETSYANVHRSVYQLAEMATEALESSRETVRGFLNARSAREVVFVRNATEGINLVAYAWGLSNLGPGDVVIATELEHHSNFVPWQYIARRTGASFRILPLDDDGELRLDALDGVAGDGRVKAVAVGVVSNALGTVNQVEQLAAWAHERGAIVVADAAQAAPHRRVDVQALGCDFLAVSAHKMCGPSGVGALWGRAELLERMEPFLLGGHMIRSVGDDVSSWAELPHKFEAGTAPMAEAVGFAAAVDYVQGVGLDAIERHEHELAAYALGRLAELPSRRPTRGHRLVRRRRRAPARRRTGARLRRGRDQSRAPLLPAAHASPRGDRHQSCELLPVHGARGDRPARHRAAQGAEGVRLSQSVSRRRAVRAGTGPASALVGARPGSATA
jgi:cysteine desulfurase/selenocysteine lyase